MLKFLRSRIPNREQITRNRWLRWLHPFLGHPRLWHWSRRGVALGVAIGMFFGLLAPIAQIPLSAAASIALRANIPIAAASTLVTNPVTFAPIYYAAYKLGLWVTGERGTLETYAESLPDPSAPPDLSEPSAPSDPQTGFWQRIGNLGLPLLVGLSIIATVVGFASYVLISLGWYLHVKYKRRRKRVGKP
ncbi:conserved exported protein of unknown function [Sterolibacterium denitrificans]|uniref:DUF2062 domain-containing protein n=1 Tax=Sterolibacterium denitrificans TaxID=157592 RepID=A0A7Z7MUC7_9PROT|nr:DUF2062 domain-containing protein [Sterolibacterium denitrificans]SMB22509.1 conserved exported protein of unknown function [Sterolibacterium denitrificans]